jgi:hypothetical protein
VTWSQLVGNASYSLTTWWAVGQASRLVPGVSNQRITTQSGSRSFKTPAGVDSAYQFHASFNLGNFRDAYSPFTVCR